MESQYDIGNYVVKALSYICTGLALAVRVWLLVARTVSTESLEISIRRHKVDRISKALKLQSQKSQTRHEKWKSSDTRKSDCTLNPKRLQRLRPAKVYMLSVAPSNYAVTNGRALRLCPAMEDHSLPFCRIWCYS